MDFLKKYNYTQKIEPSIVLYSLLNLRQLVFEVTSKCNLKCEYCGYGELYNERRATSFKNLDFPTAKKLIDYLVSLWGEEQEQENYNKPKIIVSFYGGEPLLNFSLIEKIVTYLDDISLRINKSIYYAMTTNAVLIGKHMDFLAEKKFKLLISLDGNELAHSYRIDHAGENSFNRVFKNVELLQKHHPEYFNEYVDFNSVLTNRATFFGVKKFIFEKFGKHPMVSEVNASGVFQERIDSFESIYKSSADDFNAPQNIESAKSHIHESPDVKRLYNILRVLSDNSFRTYDDLLSDKQEKNKWLPTGTCLPFSRKLFLTADGNVLPCERISQEYSIGSVSPDKVDIDFEKIASIFTAHYQRLWNRQCRYCSMKTICDKCMFHIDDLNTIPKCSKYKNKKGYIAYIQSNMNYLAQNPHIYEKLMKEFY